MRKPKPIKLPRHTIPYPGDFPSKSTAEDIFEVLHAIGKLTHEEYARFVRARDIFRRICDQLLIYVWLRGDMDDLNPPYLLDEE